MSKKEITSRLKSFPTEQSRALLNVRDEISHLLPGSKEELKWGIPTWTIEGIGVIGILGFKKHNSIFLYTVDLGSDFKTALSKYETTKGSIHFALDEEFPKSLLKRIIARRIEMINDSFPNSKGKVFEFYSNGFLKARGAMKVGELHGYWEWFRKDGTIMRSGNFKNGQNVGEWITFDGNGKVYKVTQR